MDEHLNKDSVAEAFEMVMEELDKAYQETTKQITQAYENEDFEEGQVLANRGKSLKDFQTRVDTLRKEWIDGKWIDGIDPRPEGKRPNAQQTKLRVSFPDGKVIEKYLAADTFVETIQKIGIDKVRKLGLRGHKVPLIDSVPRDDRKSVQREIRGWYICIYSGTSKKKEQLYEIAQRLGIRLKVEIISKY